MAATSTAIPASGEGAARDEVIAGLRAANAWLRELIAGRDVLIAASTVMTTT